MWRKLKQKLLLSLLSLNVLFMVYLAVRQHRHPDSGDLKAASDLSHSPLTVVIREFESFDNALVDTVKALHSTFNAVQILIVGDSYPYPPLDLDKGWNVTVVSLRVNLMHNYSSRRPDHLLRTKYVLVLPDGAGLKHWQHAQTAMGQLRSNGRVKALALPVGPDPLHCLRLHVDDRRWQVRLAEGNGTDDDCHAFVGDQALLMRSETFTSLADPFARPFSLAFYIQARLRGWKVRYWKRFQLKWVRRLFTDPHHRWKHKRLEEERQAAFFRHWDIKAVVRPSGKTDYYGCDKQTPRCFGTIVNDMPEYLYQGKWTPPCCLKALRETTKHVFAIMEQENIRYWLEGGSLLGAARHGDIIPWDYDVDVGIYREDIPKFSFLIDAQKGNFVDEDGFVWEKATEGDFFRVQYSEYNRLHVDIHPFYSRNGTMTKDTWFKTHRQDTEFPEHFLKPLTKVRFAGVLASAPNNVRQFLELKFGVGVIETPRFPDFKRVLNVH